MLLLAVYIFYGYVMNNFFLSLGAFFDVITTWLNLFRFGSEGWGDEFLRGTILTVTLSFFAFIAAIIIGLAGATAAQMQNKYIIRIINIYTTLARCLPEMFMVLLVYFVFLSIFQLKPLRIWDVDAGLFGAPIAVALISGAYSIEVFRGAYLALSKGEIEAGYAFGLNKEQVHFQIIFPHLFRIALPGLSNIWLLLLKDVALISLVGTRDLMGWANAATFSTGDLFSFYIMAALIYLFITAISENIAAKLQLRSNHSFQPISMGKI